MTDLVMTPKQFANAFRKYGSVKAVMRNERVSYRQARKCYLAAVKESLIESEGVGRKAKDRLLRKPKPEGRIRALKPRGFELPPKGEVYRYLFTCAQNNTKLHEGFWRNLLAFAEFYEAEIHVSRFAYIKSGLGASGDKAASFAYAKREDQQNVHDLWWDKRLEDYLSDERSEVAPGLVWCGEMNILPTAARPLSGLESFTGRQSGIFPHVKLALQSIPSARGEPTKFNYTTGTISQRNYIQKKAGLKAEFHHIYGALLVEVDHEGDWFCRQINANSEGVFYDLDLKVANGEVTEGHRIEAITWGDIHVAEKDEEIFEMNWGEGGIIDLLKPKVQFLHDVLHFRGRSHHEIKNPHMMFKRFIEGYDNVAKEVVGVGEFFKFAHRPFCKSVVVDSNHHHHLGRWLQEQDGREDPINAEFWLAMSQRIYANLHKQEAPNYLYEALLEVGANVKGIQFLDEDESYIVCPDAHGGIECGLHGDIGPNGSRGSSITFARMGRRISRGHTHSCDITDGVFTSGTCGDLSPDWTHGPGSWSHSHIIHYENGKRAIITQWNGKWRAE